MSLAPILQFLILGLSVKANPRIKGHLVKSFLSCLSIFVSTSICSVFISIPASADLIDSLSEVIAPPNYLEIQETEKCSNDRSYLKHDLEMFQALDKNHDYFVNRAESSDSAVADKKCVIFAMNYFAKKLMNAVEQESSSFGYCSSDKGFPKHGHKAPCITEDYVNVVYNGFQDMTDCLDIPQKMIIPKILNESGFHINAMAPLRALDKSGKILAAPLSFPLTEEQKNGRIIGGDAGIGQITGPALADIQTSIEDWSRMISKSSKVSCERLKNILGHIPTKQEIPAEVDNRCHLVNVPKNPIHSLLLYGVLYKNNRRNVEAAWESYHVDELLKQNGFDAKSNQTEKMKDTLLLLSYNAGPKTSVILFKNWLLSRSQDSKPVALNEEDFKIGYSGPGKKIAVTAASELKAISALTPEDITSLRAEYTELIKDGKSKSTRAREIQAAALNQIPFGAYLRVYRSGWAKGYLSYIKTFADTLNKELGEGACVQEHFLSL